VLPHALHQSRRHPDIQSAVALAGEGSGARAGGLGRFS
jgi:hypothetical protein